MNDEKSLWWHTTSDSASGLAHFWTKEKYSRRRSLCGRVAEAKAMQAPEQSLGECTRCQKALAAQAAKGTIDPAYLIAKLRSGYELRNRGAGWWLSAPKRASGARDAMQVEEALMSRLEADETLSIVLLTTSMRAELSQAAK